MTAELRRVEEPGKFEGGLVVDEYLYYLTLDGGPTDQCGSSTEGGGWYALLTGPFADMVAHDTSGDLTDSEREYVASLAGAIVFENSDGFVTVDHYTDGAELSDAWDVIVNEHTEEEEYD